MSEIVETEREKEKHFVTSMDMSHYPLLIEFKTLDEFFDSGWRVD